MARGEWNDMESSSSEEEEVVAQPEEEEQPEEVGCAFSRVTSRSKMERRRIDWPV